LHNHILDSEIGEACGTYGKERNAHIGSVLKLKGTGYLEDLFVDGNIT